jgi:hypothetical protein
MATWKDVEEIALGLPEVAEEPAHRNRGWKVRKKLIVWERPLREKEVVELGDAAPPDDAPILGVRVPDEEAKRALLESEPEIYFTTPHFEGSNSVLVRLDRIPRADLEEAIVEAWVSRAPKRVVASWSSSRNPPPGS